MLAQHLSNELVSTAAGGGGVIKTPINRTNERRSASICGVAPIFESNESDNDRYDNSFGLIRHASPYAVTASHRRNTRRGSLLELNG